ncbi:MAG: EamA family transporter [Alphaproteobacteria bacterium]|nr:EamA family transporter [Alphaproteobacteria bacterium]
MNLATKLDPLIIGLILTSAIIHATWNALVKSDSDRLVTFAVVMGAGSVMGLLAAPFVDIPRAEAWPWLLTSVVIHCFYYYFLLQAYAHGDLSFVYPIARGLGPLLVAVFSGTLLSEHLSFREAIGVLLVSVGIAGVAFGHGLPRGIDVRAAAFAVLTGLTIAGYTVTDGIGAKVSQDPLAYIVWLNICEGPWVMVVALFQRRGRVIGHLRHHWWRGVVGGIIATVGYGIAIWALSLGAMAHVAAIRETSVLFAALMGTFLLGESFGRRRIVAAALVVVGLLTMNLRLG